jgi:type VI secretion system secreted protein Hcp
MSDVLILDLGANITGNCNINGYAGKILVASYSHSVALPMQMDASNTERTAGRPIFSEISFTKMSDLSTALLYQNCTQGSKIGSAILYVGRVENGKYMKFFQYTFFNAMISSVRTEAGSVLLPNSAHFEYNKLENDLSSDTVLPPGGGIPVDSFSLNYTKIQCDFQQQQSDSTAKGTNTWNWNIETMQAD